MQWNESIRWWYKLYSPPNGQVQCPIAGDTDEYASENAARLGIYWNALLGHLFRHQVIGTNMSDNPTLLPFHYHIRKIM